MRRFVAFLGALVVVAGCNGSSGPYGFSGTATTTTYGTNYGTYDPTPVERTPRIDTTLFVEVTNSSTATIEVTATTPEQFISFGYLNPGVTLTVDLHELPANATLSARAVTTDARGAIPDYPTVTVFLGVDYTFDAPFVGIEWVDDASGIRADRRARRGI